MTTTLVRNGTIVTASDRYEADVYIDKGVITLIGQGLTLPADTVIDASGKLVMPGGIDVHTHLDMPFGGTTSADDFETGTIAAAHGGTTTLIDFAIQDFGEGLYPAFEALDEEGRGQGRDRLRLPHDRARAHRPGRRTTWTRMVRHEGVTSFKLFMAYPGVFMVDDATIFKALLRTRRERRADLHARRERRRHRHARQGGARRGRDGAEVPRADAADARRGRGHRPRDRARRDGRRADLHRPPLVRRTRSRR